MKTKTTYLIVIIIGFIGICSGIFSLINGALFKDYFMSFFLGITLIGTAIINQKENEK